MRKKNDITATIIWVQLMDCLREIEKQMKLTYRRRMRNNDPITWDELTKQKIDVENILDYLLTWTDKEDEL